ncbi:hypothetical protein [Streptomyces sp. NTK 937]|uniref:hypothetical protein n=1 Tax=Streptomyces sp. NTK 937 TaxID=1487711 RepID=UPI000A71F023|nr:hypothetical protein [Streptomyces sp. NTK 937]
MTSSPVVVISPSPKHYAPDACSAACTICGMAAYSEKPLTEWARAHAATHPQQANT